MEQFVLGIFQEQLAKFIVGFQKEQVNANLLNGKGEITDVELNCDFLNTEFLNKLTPFFQLSRIHVSRLSFSVSSWTNLRKAPILIDIEHVTATITEPLEYHPRSKLRRRIQQLTQSQLFQLIRQSIVPTRGQYNLFDRIVDNLTIEVQSLTIQLQTLGKFKTQRPTTTSPDRPAPWVPPLLQVRLAGIRFVSVDELGCEGSPNDVWKHNHHHHGHFHIYKKASMTCQVYVVPHGGKPIPLFFGNDPSVQVQLATKRRLRDGAVLAVQADVTLEQVEILLEQTTIPHLVHMLAGWQYCFSKDRAFVDPLRSPENDTTTSDEPTAGRGSVHPNVVVTSSSEDMGIRNELGSTMDVDTAILDESSSSSSSEEDEPVEQEIDQTNVATDRASKPSADNSVDPEDTERSPSSKAAANAVVSSKDFIPQPRANSAGVDRPIILLPNGLVIHEKISLSVAIYHATVRGAYTETQPSSTVVGESEAGNDDGGNQTPSLVANNSVTMSNDIASSPGHIQVVSKGFIGEAMWPKSDRTKGGYIQASVSYVSVQERYGSRIRTLLVGGAEHESTGQPVEKPMERRPEMGPDETFPLYEDRCIRPDPLGLRYTFPMQAFGLKSSIEFVNKLTRSGGESEEHAHEEDVRVHHEMGIESFDIVLDTESWCRAILFAINEKGEGFDPRWHTGDWSEHLTRDMLVDPSSPLNLDEYVQPMKQIFLDENEFPSSDLLQVTARTKSIEVRIPAAILDDVRSSDICLSLGEAILVVSSALPRTFLSGRIGSSVNGDEATLGGVIDFPNDPSDVAYSIERQEDPSDRQRGIMTTHAISTFRLSLTLREVSVRLSPIVPLCLAQEPKTLLAPTELTMIFCFEGEPPESSEMNQMKIVLLTSILAHRFDINIDFDLATSAIGTLAHHAIVLQDAAEICKNIFITSSHHATIDESEHSMRSDTSEGRLRKTLAGRKVLVRRQIHNSRQTGGLSIAFCLQAAGISVTLWRQNVGYCSPLRSSFSVQSSSTISARSFTPLIKIVTVNINEAEAGVEATVRGQYRRIVVKACITEMETNAVDLSRLLDEERVWITVEGDKNKESSPTNADPVSSDGTSNAGIYSIASGVEMIEILKIGSSSGDEGSSSNALRIEEEIDQVRSWSLAADVEKGVAVYCDIEAIEALVLLVFEAFLLPAWLKPNIFPSNFTSDGSWVFPEGSVGALFLSALRCFIPRPEDSPLVSMSSDEGRVPGGVVDRFLRDMIEKVIPDDVKVVLVRFGGRDVIIKVPSAREDPSCFGLLVQRIDFLASYIADSDSSRISDVMKRLGRVGSSWSSILPSLDKGLRHSLQSRQRLISCLPALSGNTTGDTLVEPFDCSYSYAKSKAHLSTGQESITVMDVEKLDLFLSSLHEFAGSCKGIVSRISRALSIVRRTKSSASQEQETAEQDLTGNPVEVACTNTAALIRNARDFLREANSRTEEEKAALYSLVQTRDREISLLKRILFEKEKERLSALALSSARVTGFLRIGTSQKYGQRGMTTWSLWQKWCILRRSLLIMFPSPEEHNPSAVINLAGASLRQLRGGRRKRDLKRAFAIVESTGVTHVVVTNSDREFNRWVHELYHVMGFPEGDDFRLLEDDLDGSQRSSENDRMPFSASENEAGTRRRAVGRSFTRAVQVAKKTGVGAVQVAKAGSHAIAERGRRIRADTGSSQSEFETERDVGSLETGRDFSHPGERMRAGSDCTATTAAVEDDISGQNRRQQLRNKFAGVSQATKRGFGSALLAAKQKGKDVAVNTRMRMAQGSPTGLEQPRSPQFEARTALTERVSDESQPVVVGPDHDWFCDECSFANTKNDYKCRKCNSAYADYSSNQLHDKRQISVNVSGQVPIERRRGAGSVDGQSDATLANLVDEDTAVSMNDRSVLPPRTDSTTTTDNEDKVGGRFSLLRRSNSGISEKPDTAMKLRSVAVSDQSLRLPIPQTNENEITRQNMPRKQLEGRYIVRVEPFFKTEDSVTDNDEMPSSIVGAEITEEHQPPNQESLDKSKEGDSQPKSRSETEEKMQNMADKKTSLKALEEVDIWALDVPYRIQTLQAIEKENFVQFEQVSAVEKSVDDILELHTKLSESLSLSVSFFDEGHYVRKRSGEMGTSLSQSLGLTALDTVRICGKLLSGLLGAPPSDTKKFSRYCAATICEFLGSMLDCSLPVDCLSMLVDFLGLMDASTRNESPGTSFEDERQLPIAQMGSLDAKLLDTIEFMRGNVDSAFTVTSLSDESLVRAEGQALLAAQLAAQREEISLQSTSWSEFELNQPTSHHFREAMYSALMTVMEERDEAHARMVASGVLHVHELEQQKKNVRRLSTELDSLRKNATLQNPALKVDGRMSRVEKEMQQDAEIELLSMCQQLSSEISARTAASLEVVRLKESRNLERQNEAAERHALEEELRITKAQLAEERAKLEKAHRQSRTWKESFEKSIESKGTDA